MIKTPDVSVHSVSSVVGMAAGKEIYAAILEAGRTGTGAQRSLAFGHLIRDVRANLLQASFVDGATGPEIAARIAGVTDGAIIALFDLGQELYPDAHAKLSVVAVGGYGRGYLAPFSDIDLLFLHAPQDRETVAPLVHFILYALYDTGINIAQAVHSATSALTFAQQDLKGRTSYLDARLLCGAEKREVGKFWRGYDRLRRHTIADFVQAKMAERDARYVTADSSRYRVEPDIKVGKGGLRDVDLLHWLQRYRSDFLKDTQTAKMTGAEWVGEDRHAYLKAITFLWSVRVHMHDIRGRPAEVLRFDIQPEIARRLGYRERGRMLAVERFMKHYFLTTREVGRLTGVLSAILEEAAVKKVRSNTSVFWFPTDPKRDHSVPLTLPKGKTIEMLNIQLIGARLAFANDIVAARTPKDLFQLFQVAGLNPELELHPTALKTVRIGADGLKKKKRTDPELAQIFCSMLLESRQVETLLRDMSEPGLLGIYLPPFRRLVGRTQYGLFRRFTIDEHVIKSVGVVDRIRHGYEKQQHPIATEILYKEENILPCLLATLLHETGTALAGHPPTVITKNILETLERFTDLSKDTAARIACVCTDPSLMQHMAILRNVLSPRLIKRLATTMVDIETLNMALVVTTAHRCTAGIDGWSRWWERSISTLYHACMAYLEGGETQLQEHIATFVSGHEQETEEYLKDHWPRQAIADFFHRLPAGFWTAVDPPTAARFALAATPLPATLDTRKTLIADLDDGHCEIITYARDRPGLFADIAGAVTGVGARIVSAYAFSVQSIAGEAPMAANIFVIQRTATQTHDALDQALEAAVRRLLSGQTVPMTPHEKGVGDRRPDFVVPTRVTIDLCNSDSSTIVEVEGRDCAGTLYAMATALTRQGLTIQSAYVSTYGERFVDSFYVQDEAGRKVRDAQTLERIQQALHEVVEDV